MARISKSYTNALPFQLFPLLSNLLSLLHTPYVYTPVNTVLGLQIQPTFLHLYNYLKQLVLFFFMLCYPN